MIDLRPSPLAETFQQFMDTLRSPCLICSPYISAGPVARMLASVDKRNLRYSLDLRVVTDVSVSNLVQGSTDISALIQLAEQIPNTTVNYLPRVHAKVYISGDEFALLGSANFTDGGAYTNFEYVAAVKEPALVRAIRGDIERYASLGGKLSINRLRELESQVTELRAAIRDEERSIGAKLRAAMATLEREADDQLLRCRVEGRSLSSVFAETVLYLLSEGPMPTVQLHERIRGIHPDLCDDTLDRVIDGQHFGKLWKHQVRTAQQHLKQAGLIVYDVGRRLWARRLPP